MARWPLWAQALILALLGLTFRVVFFAGLFIDVDAYGFLRMAEDFRAGLQNGDVWSQPWSASQYYTAEYWPAAFSLCTAAFSLITGSVADAAWLLGIFLGTALVLVALMLGRDVAGPLGGLMAGALAACNPMLVWYSQVPRTEALYVPLYGAGVWLVARASLAPRGVWAFAAGLVWGLACCTRWEAMMGAALAFAVLLVGALRRKLPWWRVPLFLLGFWLVYAPCFAFLWRLNDGPAVTPPAKRQHDTLEMLWIVRATPPSAFVRGGQASGEEFLRRFGLHGEYRYDPSVDVSPQVAAMLPRIVVSMCYAIPACAHDVLLNLSPLLLIFALLGARAAWQKAQTRIVAIFLLPAVAYFALIFWDPHPRYWGSFVLPTIVLAAAWVARGEWRGGGLAAFAFTVFLMLSWSYPAPSHPDDHMLAIGPYRLSEQLRLALQDPQLLGEPYYLPARLFVTGLSLALLCGLQAARGGSAAHAAVAAGLVLSAVEGCLVQAVDDLNRLANFGNFDPGSMRAPAPGRRGAPSRPEAGALERMSLIAPPEHRPPHHARISHAAGVGAARGHLGRLAVQRRRLAGRSGRREKRIF